MLGAGEGCSYCCSKAGKSLQDGGGTNGGGGGIFDEDDP